MSMRTMKVAVEDTDWDACPSCGSDHIEGGEVMAEGTEAWQGVSCDDCGVTWVEIYEAARREYEVPDIEVPA